MGVTQSKSTSDQQRISSIGEQKSFQLSTLLHPIMKLGSVDLQRLSVLCCFRYEKIAYDIKVHSFCLSFTTLILLTKTAKLSSGYFFDVVFISSIQNGILWRLNRANQVFCFHQAKPLLRVGYRLFGTIGK